jgi:S-adenosylmethionine decarboxylase
MSASSFRKLIEETARPLDGTAPNPDPEVRVYATLKLGEHYICDLSACNPTLLKDTEKLYSLFSRAVRDSGLTVVEEGRYEFSPHGFTCFLLLAESHASLHAWPEHGYCAVDLFTCRVGIDLTPLIEELQAGLEAHSCTVHKLEREAQLVWEA